MNTIPPCRLYVILARNAPVGVIFRRGPAKQVQIIRWDTTTDTFTPGQWFKGRTYEETCDLSPDGSLLVYFASKQKMREQQSDYKGTWTAISKLPYLTALALWPAGFTGFGGGLFLSDNQVQLDITDYYKPHKDHLPKNLLISYASEGQRCETSILDRRLRRDGWHTVQEWRGEFIKGRMLEALEDTLQTGEPITQEWLLSHPKTEDSAHYVNRQPGIREKARSDEGPTLILVDSIIGFTRTYIYSIRSKSGEEQSLEGVAWADWDHRGRLVFAKSGKVFVCETGEMGVGPAHEIADFNANKFEPVISPDWARHR